MTDPAHEPARPGAPMQRTHPWREERGEVNLLKTVLIVAVTALVLYEAGSIGINRIQLDDIGNKGMRAAAQAYSSSETRSQAAIEEAVEQGLRPHPGVQIDEVVADDHGVTITISREAPTMLVSRVDPIADWGIASVTKHADRE